MIIINLFEFGYTYQFAEEHRINGVEDFDLLGVDLTQLTDVNNTPVVDAIPNMQATTPNVSAILLTSEELDAAESLRNELSELSIPLPPSLKNQVEQLAVKIERYKELACRLHEVHQALIDGQTTNIKNEVIDGLNIVTPILWFKQYEKENYWHTVPGSSHVTDKDALLHWLKLNPTDPTNRDIVKEPTKYKGMPTRYRWHLLTPEYCSSQELHETAVEIHQLLEILPGQVQSIMQNKMSIGTVPQTFFGTSQPTEPEQPKIDHLVTYQPG